MKRPECISETRWISTSKYYSDLDAIGQSKVLSVLDEARGYLRIETEKRGREKTAFSRPQGHFQFNKMCFEFMITTGTYQRRHTVISTSCHHGMARPLIADVGTSSNMEGSCEYIEQAVAGSRQGVVFQLTRRKNVIFLTYLLTYLLTYSMVQSPS